MHKAKFINNFLGCSSFDAYKPIHLSVTLRLKGVSASIEGLNDQKSLLFKIFIYLVGEVSSLI